MTVRIENISELKTSDLDELCEATENAIREGIGFNWVTPPMREVLENYWRGVLVVPERVLFGCRLDGILAGSIQLVKPGPTKETSSFAASIEAHFVAPWARGHGLARGLLQHAEREAQKLGFSVLRLNVRETQEAAIRLYEESAYTLWGKLPYYEFVNARMVAGNFYYKKLELISSLV